MYLEMSSRGSLASESVQSAALTLESIDNVHGCDGLALGVLGVGNSVTDNVLEEDLEDTASLLVDEARDTLDTTTASETTDGGLGDTLDVITQDFAVPLGSAFSKTFASLSATRHDDVSCAVKRMLQGRLERRALYAGISVAQTWPPLRGESQSRASGEEKDQSRARRAFAVPVAVYKRQSFAWRISVIDKDGKNKTNRSQVYRRQGPA